MAILYRSPVKSSWVTKPCSPAFPDILCLRFVWFKQESKLVYRYFLGQHDVQLKFSVTTKVRVKCPPLSKNENIYIKARIGISLRSTLRHIFFSCSTVSPEGGRISLLLLGSISSDLSLSPIFELKLSGFSLSSWDASGDPLGMVMWGKLEKKVVNTNVVLRIPSRTWAKSSVVMREANIGNARFYTENFLLKRRFEEAASKSTELGIEVAP